MASYEKEICFTPVRLRVMCYPKQTRSPAFLELNHRGKTPETENLHNTYDALEDAHFGAEKAGNFLDLDERAELVAKWEVYANKSTYIAGEEFGLADCAFSPLLGYMVHRGFDWTRPAYFERVWERGREKGCAQRAQPAGWDRQGRENVWTGLRGR
ncbi:hypothetical protein C8F04DRAFT_1209037 [Mycena alexandri]|uniref:GST C-terminal domain-containing protein n=1 Tax=Mycena alexandri TaxID=1745969 RepID=A0AAD6T545_9AGAR|nr:hypothetical protein C8F04DRAFT_1209037 [Mycena alexandri]